MRSPRAWLLSIAGMSSFWLVVLYRVAHSLHKGRVPVLPQLCRCLGLVLWSAEIWPEATIGPGFRIAHTPGVVIGSATIAGERLTLFHNVTLGGGTIQNADRSRNHPLLGDDVTIYSGAVIAGGIEIGDGATVGANSVVLTHVAAGVTVAGSPARPIAAKGIRGIPNP